MRINSNTVSPNQPSFQKRVKQITNNQQQASAGNAYRLDFSNWAMDLVDSLDDNIQIFNEEVLNYNRNLELTFKQKI